MTASSGAALASVAPTGTARPDAVRRARRSRGPRLRKWPTLRLLCTLAFVLGSGCGATTSQATPEAAVDSFARAIRAGQYTAAYNLMSERYRQRVPFEEFRRYLESHPRERNDLADSLGEASGPVQVQAVVPYGEGEDLRLVREGGQWRFDRNLVDFYDQSTPRAALRSFIRAMERRRYEVVMRFVPDADREGMSVEQMKKAWEGDGREEIERLLANLRANIDNPIEVVGNRATMPYGERFTVQFLREDGVWKIEDPD